MAIWGPDPMVISRHRCQHLSMKNQSGRVSGVRSTTPFETLLVPADDSHEREFTGHLNQYYAQVIESIRNAESIQIFGPGEAKGELKKRLELAKYDGLILAMETTDRQIAAKVREHSHKWTPTPLPKRHHE